MATNQEWHYVKDGIQHGPVTSSDLEVLASSGELSPSDLIWKEGMADWKSAGKFKGLFPETDSSNDGDSKPSPSTSNTDAISGEPKLEPKRSLLASAKSAAQFATNKAERTKLTSLTLPSLFQALGRHCYSSPEFRDEFTEPFQKLDQIRTSQSEIASRVQPATKTLGEKAKAMGGQAMQAVESKKLSLRQSSMFGSLGKAVYEKHEEKSGPQDLVKTIHDTLARISTLDQELKTLPATGGGLRVSAKQTALGILFHPASVFLSMLMCFPIGLILVWKHPVWTNFRKLRWTGGFCAVVFSLVCLSIHLRHEAAVSLASANQLWSAGDKDMAVPKYKRAISLALGVIPEGERPVIFKRVIEHEVEHGNNGEAKRFIQKAKEYDVALALNHPAARKVLEGTQPAKTQAASTAPSPVASSTSSLPPTTTPTLKNVSAIKAQKVADFLSSDEARAMKNPIAAESFSDSAQKRRNIGVEFVRTTEYPPDLGYFLKDGQSIKDVTFYEKSNNIHWLTVYHPDHSTKSQWLHFSSDGWLYLKQDFDSRGNETHAVRFRNDKSIETETFFSDGISRKTVWYYENGRIGAEYRDDPRASSGGSQFWDKDAKTIDQDAFCKMQFGSDWRGNYSREGDRNQKRNIQDINEAYKKIRSKGN